MTWFRPAAENVMIFSITAVEAFSSLLQLLFLKIHRHLKNRKKFMKRKFSFNEMQILHVIVTVLMSLITSMSICGEDTSCILGTAIVCLVSTAAELKRRYL